MRTLAFLALLSIAVAGCGGSDKSSPRDTRTTPKAPANRVVHVPVGGNPAAITSGFGRVWAVGHRNGVVYVIDPATARVTHRIAVGGIQYTGLAAGLGAIWVVRDDTQTLVRINQKTLHVERTSRPGTSLTALTPVADTLWAVAPEQHTLVGIDPATMRIVKRAKLPGSFALGDLTPPSEAGGALWVGGYKAIAKVDPANGRVLETVRVADQAGAVVATEAGVYFTYPSSTQLMRVGARGGRPKRVGPASPQPGLLKLISRNLILTDDRDADVIRLDPATGRPIARLRLRGEVKLRPGQFAETIGLIGITGTEDALWFADWAANVVHRVPLARLGG